MAGNIEQSEALKRLIDALNLNQTGFSAKLGIPKSNLSQMLSGKRSISSAVILKIKERFANVNIYYLLSGEGEMFTAEAREVDGKYYTPKQIADMEEKVRRYEIEILRLKAELYDQITKSKEK